MSSFPAQTRERKVSAKTASTELRVCRTASPTSTTLRRTCSSTRVRSPADSAPMAAMVEVSLEPRLAAPGSRA